MSDFTEHDLIAFHLNELSLQRELELRTALATDPELAAESQAIAATLGLLRDHAPAPAVTAAVAEHHWQRLRPALAPARPTPAVWWRSFSLGTVCGLALPCLYLLLHSSALFAPTPPQPPSPQAGLTAAPLPPAAPPVGPAVVSSGVAGPVHTSAIPSCIVREPLRELALNPPAALLQGSTPGATPPGGHAPSALPNPDTSFQSAREAASSARSLSELTPAVQAPGASNPNVTVASTNTNATPELSPAPRRPGWASRHRLSLTAAVLGNLTLTRNAVNIQSTSSSTNAYSQTVSEDSAPGGLLSLELPFTRRLGVRLDASTHPANYSYTDGAAIYTTSSVSGFEAGRIQTQQYEFFPSAVLRFPTSTRISPYLQAGAGAMIFAPKGASGPSTSRQYRAAGLIGSGINVRLSRHVDVTAGYRGVIYRTPLFTTEGTTTTGSYTGPVLVRRTLSSQPFVGITYTFGKGGSE